MFASWINVDISGRSCSSHDRTCHAICQLPSSVIIRYCQFHALQTTSLVPTYSFYTFFSPFPQNCENALLSWELHVTWFSSRVAVLAASAHSFFCRFGVNLASFNMACTRPYRVANLRSTLPFCWGVPGAVNSKLIPNPFCSYFSLNATISPALSYHMYFTLIFFALRSFINLRTFSTRSFL